jgi:hypothetical protein
MSPFGKVRFKDFFFADIITSMGKPLTDLGCFYVYMEHKNWESGKPVDKKNNDGLFIF